jgi:LysR family glycine cleavage system transcriptional activator
MGAEAKPGPSQKARAWRAPPLRRLLVFDVLARTRSLRAAALELDLTPERLRRRISELEAEIGTPLIRCEGDTVLLSTNGQNFFSAIGPEIAAINRIWRESRTADSRSLVVSASPINMSMWLGPRLARWTAERPRFRVLTAGRGSGHGFGAEGEDVVFTPAPFSTDPREVAHVVTAHMVCVGAGTHSGERSAGLPARVKLLDPARGPANKSIWDLWFRSRGVERLATQEILPTDDLLVRQCAILGQGVALLSLASVRDDLADGRLRILDNRTLRFRYYLRWRPELAPSPALQSLLDFLLEEGRRHEAEETGLLSAYALDGGSG